MSKSQIIRSLRREIFKINTIIDQKIIEGRSYYIEARRHKFLVAQLQRLTPPRLSMFGRSLGFVSMFMF